MSAPSDRRLQFLQQAAEFRAEMLRTGCPVPAHGFVCIYGVASAWCRQPVASEWVPGTVAVSWDGRLLRAVGGNHDDGAESWEVLP